jgi:ABC-type multidrug transport system fused ATPase/permease subunit
MEQATAEYARQQGRLAWINGLQSGLSGLLANGAMWAVLAAGVALTAGGKLDGVYLAALALATSASFEAILPLPLAAQSLETALAAARRLFAAADTPPAVSDPPHPAPVPATGALEVRGLSLAYAPSGPLSVREVSFDLPPGKHLAVVGPSGAGKSTLLSALVRFCDPAAGQVRLDGLDLRAYAQADVRRSITLVGQTTHLFNASIEDNLRLGRPQATEAEVTRAAEQAQLHDFIASLPEGGATWIGERGVRLSAGQRQRLALARALLRDTPVLILDEPTANLDPATERVLLRALLEARRGRSLILATHRLVGLEAMDEILVLDRGEVVQRGRHPALAAAPGLYRRLWEIQNRAALPQR